MAAKYNTSNEKSDEYRRKREKNNEAVKHSREKNKKKIEDTKKNIVKMKGENKKLEKSIENLKNELGIMKTAFIKHTVETHGVPINETEFDRLLRDSQEINEDINQLLKISQRSLNLTEIPYKPREPTQDGVNQHLKISRSHPNSTEVPYKPRGPAHFHKSMLPSNTQLLPKQCLVVNPSYGTDTQLYTKQYYTVLNLHKF